MRIPHLLHRAAFALALSFLACAASADAPQVRTQAPGFYRMMLGDIEVTALSDGTIGLHPTQLLTNTSKRHVQSALGRAFLTEPVETSVNAYLVNTGSKLVMVDAGAGKLFGPTVGALVDNLQAAGYRPEQIDEIYITHLHPDHVGGLANDGQPVFPNAVVRADQRDADFWLSQANLDAAPEEAKGFFRGAMASIGPYQTAGRFKPFSGDTELVPGVRAVSAFGHTKGHTVYVVESQGHKLMLWGDVMHVAAVQFRDPSVTISFDTDSKEARAQRRKIFAAAARQGYWVAGSHLAFPGIGHLRREGRGYAFVPANYSRGPVEKK